MPKKGDMQEFKTSHASISARDPQTSSVTSIMCCFCNVFGCKENVGRNLGVWSLGAINSMVDSGNDSLSPLVTSICCLFVDAAADISKILENEGSNVANDALSPVLPVKLSRIEMRDLVKTT